MDVLRIAVHPHLGVECAAYLMVIFPLGIGERPIATLCRTNSQAVNFSLIMLRSCLNRVIYFLNDCCGMLFSITIFFSHIIIIEFATMQAICAQCYEDIAVKRKTNDLNLYHVTMLGLFLLNEQLCSTVKLVVREYSILQPINLVNTL